MTNPVDSFNNQVNAAISQFQKHPSESTVFSARITELLAEISPSTYTQEESSLLTRSLQVLTSACQTPELAPLAEKVNTLQIELLLNTWALAGTPKENREKAKERILAFLHSASDSSIDLWSLRLADLPDIFNHPSFSSRLTSLNLSNTRLTSLPESFGNLIALKMLYLSDTRLTSLPKSFGSLSALETLYLNYTPLISLPESFGNLIALKTLHLNYTQLTSLPESFGSLLAIQELYLYNTPLTSLPESFGSLLALQELELSNNTQLTSLPESFGSLIALQTLHLNYAQLTSLPESFGNLIALQKLYLNYTQLASLPKSFGNLSALQTLYLNNTQLTSLPESFDNLRALQYLNLTNTRLTFLPESFSNLRALQGLYLNNTQLTSLPESLNRLTALRHLELSNNTQLTSLPSIITSLPRNLSIDISTLPLSEEIRSRLQAATQALGYAGPTFIYSMAHVERRGEDLRSTVELVRDLYRELHEPPLTLSEKLEESAQLRSWLSRLSYMADYKAGGENKKALLQNILAYLRLTNENLEFQEVFLAIINGAADTCGDRVALSILQIGIAYKIHRADLRRPQDLAHLLLRGVYAINLLADIARAKASTLRFFDEIEVYLGYPLKLQKTLDLPIDVREMLYFRCSALTDTDLRNAESFVKEQLNNSDACHQFLVHHETWLQCLKENYRREFNALTQVRASDLRVDTPDYTKIQEDYEKGLIDLTKKALKNIDDTHEASVLISPPLKKRKR